MFCSIRCIRGYSGLNVWPSFRYSPSRVTSSSFSLATSGLWSTAGRVSTPWLSACCTRLSFAIRSVRAFRSASDRTPSCWVTRSSRSPVLSGEPRKRMSFSCTKRLRLTSAASSLARASSICLARNCGGVARGLDLLIETLGDEGLRQRVGDARGQVRIVALEGDLDEPRIADGLDGQPPLEGRGSAATRARDPLHPPAARAAAAPGTHCTRCSRAQRLRPSRPSRHPARGRWNSACWSRSEKSDHPIRQRAALQDLELGLVVVLLGVGLHDLLELEDPRLVLLDPEGRRGREDRAGRECPDRRDEHAHRRNVRTVQRWRARTAQ